jgi:N-acetyltransferase
VEFQVVADPRPDAHVFGEALWPPAADVQLDGQHVSLRLAQPADAAELFAAVDHDACWQHVRGRCMSAAQWAERIAAEPKQSMARFVIRDVHGHLVGTSALWETSVVDARTEIGHTQYTPAVWGSAVNPEAKLLLLGFAFDTLGMGRVQLKTDVRNVRSQRAIASLGAHYEGLLRHYQRRADGTVRDTVLFSIVLDEWPSVRERLLARLAAVSQLPGAVN